MELVNSTVGRDAGADPEVDLDQLLRLARIGLVRAARAYGRDLDPGFPAYAARIITAQPGWVNQATTDDHPRSPLGPSA